MFCIYYSPVSFTMDNNMYDVYDFDINEQFDDFPLIFLSVNDIMKIALDLLFNDIIHE